MYISLKWLTNFVNLKNVQLSLLCNQLTLAGFEIESVAEKRVFGDFDTIIDVSLTANRPDIFNITDMSQEIGTILDLTEKKAGIKFSQKSRPRIDFFSYQAYQKLIQKHFFFTNCQVDFDFTQTHFEKCSLFFTFEFQGVIVKNSPKWVQQILTSSNLKPSNNILDIANLILLETGYPFTIYDLSQLQKIAGDTKLSFGTRFAKNNEKFQSINNQNLFLSEENLLIFVNDTPISIAGLADLPELAVTEKTTKILIQGSLFDPTQIRKSAQSLGLRTEVSARFEKRLNVNSLEKALIRLYHLFYAQRLPLQQLFKPRLKHIILADFLNQRQKSIVLHYKNVTRVLGELVNFQTIQKEEIINTLQKLKFSIETIDEISCKVSIPLARTFDINREIDLIEEIGRIAGFNSFYAQLPTVSTFGKISKLEKIKRQLRNSFLGFGFHEVFHPTLISFSTKNQISLKNPLLSESSSLRLSLLDVLIQKVAFNQNQTNQLLDCFEIGRTYSYQSSDSLIEKEVIAGVFNAKPYKKDWVSKNITADWLQAKGLLEDVIAEFDFRVKWQKPIQMQNFLFHPERFAELFLDDKKLGLFGELHPKWAKSYGLSNKFYLFELNLDNFESSWLPKELFTYSPYSLYPSSIIDISCIVPKKRSFEEIQSKIKEIGEPLLKSVELFDYYSGEEIPLDYCSLGFKLMFQAQTRTLKNKEIESIISQIIKELQSNLQVIFRNKN